MLEPGATLQTAKYTIQTLVGSGGFGVTYQAVHNLLRTAVVVKEYFPRQIVHRDPRTNGVLVSGKDEGFLTGFEVGKKTFLSEARFLYGKKHPNIVTVLDFFEENNTAYLVMEYLEGHDLRLEIKSIPDRKLSEARTREVMQSLVAALTFLHGRNIYHLDIKPANVMCCDDGRIVLIDFGAARQGTTLATQSHLSFSLDYAPPELLHERTFGPATDIFEVGMMLHELLTGQLPPGAIERLVGKQWEPKGLTEPWNSMVREAVHLKQEERPQDILAWWKEATVYVPPTATAPAPASTPILSPTVHALTASEEAGETVLMRPSRLTPIPTATPPRTAIKEKKSDGMEIVPRPRRSRIPWFAGLAIVAVGLTLLGSLYLVTALKEAEQKKKAEQSVSNLKQLAVGLIMYLQDYDDVFPPMATMEELKPLVLPYVKGETTFINPLTGGSYQTNSFLSLRKAGQLSSPAEKIMMMESKPDASGKRGVAYVDGHIKRVDEAIYQKGL